MISPINYRKTRFAPTPSGFLHFGNVLSFAMTAAFASRYNAKILLRIDDIDKQRAGKEYVKDIFDSLEFLQIPWHEGPRDVLELNETYSQINRLHLYDKALDQLRNDGHVFACKCSRKLQQVSSCKCREMNISLDSPEVSWRFITNKNPILVKELTGAVIESLLPPEMHNFIVRKKDGFPAYQLTSVVDDLYFGVDLIVRGMDLLPSTLAQHQLAAAMAQNRFQDNNFYHHPLITDASGNKLSKSAGATSINYLRNNGKTSADIFNLIAGVIGIKESVENWLQLGDVFVKHNPDNR